jgi:hypothetical protein
MGTVNLTIFVQDIATALASYDTLKVGRSTDGENGTYYELTAAAAAEAELTAPNIQNYDVVAKTLQLIVDHAAQQDIVFTGVGELSADQVASQINAIIASIASEVGGYLNLKSTLTGTVSVIDIVGGGAAAEFGWVAGDRDIGEEQYVALLAGVSTYQFTDRDGEADYWYRSAYYNTSNGLQSAWSEPFKGAVGTVITAPNLSLATIDMVDPTGAAVSEQKITFHPMHVPLQVEGYQAAMLRSSLTIETDNTGHAEVSLIRGLRLRVVFEGTSYIREITVPDQATFDILDLMAAAPDPFSPVSPEIPDAIRRSL